MNSKRICIPTIQPRSVSRKLAVAFVGLGLLSYGVMADGARENKRASGAGVWSVYTYVGEDGPFPSKATPLSGGGVSFDFLVTPDRALIVTEHPSYKKTLLGDQTGGTVSATIGISSVLGTTFVHYDDCLAPANVRLHLATASPIPIELGSCSSGGAVEHTALWWSNPVSIDLAELNNNGPMTLSAALNPRLWSDTCGHLGDSDDDHKAAFAAAVSHIDRIGLSFGGGCNFAFGAGSEPAGATFMLLRYSVTH